MKTIGNTTTHTSLHIARQLSFEEFSRNSQTAEHFSIDESFLEQFADELSQREVFNKHLFRPNTYLHKWWARRCGSTFHTILKQVMSDTAKCRDAENIVQKCLLFVRGCHILHDRLIHECDDNIYFIQQRGKRICKSPLIDCMMCQIRLFLLTR